MAKAKAKSIRTDVLNIPALRGGERMTGVAIAAALGCKTTSSRSTLANMVRDGQLLSHRTGCGITREYSIPPTHSPATLSPRARLDALWVPTRIPDEWLKETTSRSCL